MSTFYLIIIIILFLLAISDLIVGVSNDAVNFLNSAVGSKAAHLWVILIVASLGVLIGAMFSGGLMEVARKGIFHPDQFNFNEVMIIFLAVMITDVILLDTFNTLGLPTSTTVSIVFELLGGSVAVALIKISHAGEGLQDLSNYINSSKALAIISGILVSVAIAFTVGAIVQYFARLAFTFNYKKSIRYFGSVWAGLSLTAITYFMLIKGAKGSVLFTQENLEWIKNNTINIMVYGFLGWTLFFQLLKWFTRINILKIIVLVGTFALAMAFAGNDLVNFIGVPIAGYESFIKLQTTADATSANLNMEFLKGSVPVRPEFLITAGLVMVFTLWLSKKARSVTKTEINLGRQFEGDERFQSSLLSRTIVRQSISFAGALNYIIPDLFRRKIRQRFEQKKDKSEKVPGEQKDSSFDLIRASVNLVVASTLIALGTSMKLPLSTTYVTFMVAMGSSLADKAWGRESAVYRVSGVLSVVGGWFITALLAFTVSFVIALIIFYGGMYIIIIVLAIVLFLVIKSYNVFRKKEKEESRKEELSLTEKTINGTNIIDRCAINVIDVISRVLNLYNDTIKGLTKEKLKLLKKTYKEVKNLNTDTKQLKNRIPQTIRQLEEDSIETGHFYVQALDYLREIAHCINYITVPSFEHVDNNHKQMSSYQSADLNMIREIVADLLMNIQDIIQKSSYENVSLVIEKQQHLLDTIMQAKKSQIKRIRGDASPTRNSLLFLDILSETKNLSLHAVNLLKSHRDFIIHIKNYKH